MKNHILLLLSLVLCLSSCKTKQKVESQSLPQEIRVINDHYYNDDLDALTNDYKLYPQHKEYVYDLLFDSYGFSSLSYEDIFFLQKANSDNPNLQAGFGVILGERQLDIIDKLHSMSLDSLYLYYMRYPVRRDIVENFLDSTIIRVLPELDYPEIKYVANLFEGTHVGDKMRQIQYEQKTKKTTILEDLNNFTLCEIGSLDILKKEVEAYALRSAFDNLEGFMEKMMENDFPKEEKGVKRRVNTLIRQTMSNEVEKFVESRVKEYIDEINNVRKSCFISLSDNPVKALNSLNNEIFVDYNKLVIPQYRIQYNPEPLYVISKKQNRRDWIGGALTIISFAPIPFIDALDLTYGVGSTIKVQHDIKKQNINFLNDFAESIKKTTREYSEKIANVINEELTKSQNKFKTEIYEIY